MKHEVVFVIVGSHKLTSAPARVIGYIANLPAGAVIALRSPKDEAPGLFERMVAQTATVMKIKLQWFKPGIGGREATYYRDIEMVRAASCVLAFFSEDEMSGGTEHVVEKAIDQQVPVYSYGLREGVWVLIGSHDPDDLWPGFTI